MSGTLVKSKGFCREYTLRKVKKMKKILTIVLAMTMVLSLAACGGAGNTTSESTQAAANSSGVEDGVLDRKSVV